MANLAEFIDILDLKHLDPVEMWINPQWLNNDHVHYQRFRIESRVNHLMTHESERKRMIGIVAVRPDESYWVINGQHHTEAAVRLGVYKLFYLTFKSTGYELEKVKFDLFQQWQKAIRQ